MKNNQQATSVVNIKTKVMDKKVYWSRIFATAAIIGVSTSLPQYFNWLTNTTIFSPWLTTIVQIAVIATVLYVFGKKVAVESDKGDGYTYGKAFGFAIIASLVSGIFSAVMGWILINALSPNMANDVINKAVEEAQKMNAPTEAIKMSVEMAKFFLTMGGLLITNILSMGLIGGFIGLFTSAAVKRNPTL